MQENSSAQVLYDLVQLIDGTSDSKLIQLNKSVGEHCKKRHTITAEPVRDAQNWAILLGGRREYLATIDLTQGMIWKFPDKSLAFISAEGDEIILNPAAFGGHKHA